MFGGVFTHIFGDLHRAEVRATHGTEVSGLGAFLRQGLVMEFTGRDRIETQVELILPPEFKPCLRQRIVPMAGTRMALREIRGVRQMVRAVGLLAPALGAELERPRAVELLRQRPQAGATRQRDPLRAPRAQFETRRNDGPRPRERRVQAPSSTPNRPAPLDHVRGGRGGSGGSHRTP